MSQPCHIQLLGTLRVQQAARLLTRFPTYKTAALLASLAYHPQPQSRERLIETFWPDTTPERGRNNLSNALSSLRNLLEPPGVPAGAVLLADRQQVSLNPAGVHTDVREFEQALQQAASTHNDRQRAEHLQTAVDLYTGELLPGYYEEWIVPERQRLAEAYVQSLRRLIRFLVKHKQPTQAIDYALRALTVDPLREEPHRDLMKLYVAVGQPSAALQQYRQLEQILRTDLNARPSAATQQVLQEIEARLQQSAMTPPPTPSASAEPAPAAPRPSLPAGTVTFLLTDIAGSTAQWERTGEAYRQALEIHHALLRRQFARYGGQEFKEVGDAFLVAFERPSDAMRCAIASQCALAEQLWPGEIDSLRVRMALHTGEATPEAGDYHSPTLHRASRLLSAAHGGQILCSETTASLLHRDLPDGVDLHDRGLYRLRDLPTPEHLFEVTSAQMPQREFPAPNADAGFTSSLPLSFTRFFGREREQARLQEWLLEAKTRLVTLTGMGGTGKTRLALEVGRSLEEAFGGAVWFVGLADIADAALIVTAIAGGLRLTLSAESDPLDQVVAALSRRPSLLILDNFEQLVEMGGRVVQALLSRVPLLSILVTSRQVLGLEGERELALAPLTVPGGGHTLEQLCLYESVQLFIDRAQAVKPDFQVTSQNAAAVATLCLRLEGIPLAIELAAARSQVLTPSQILAQLENRFDFLSSRRRDVSERHRTLRAAMEWSYRLLSPQLQRFFARLSVFRGGWTSAAAEGVCEEGLALDCLAQLRECSLVLVEEAGEEIRFGMLETVREYASEQLAGVERWDALVRHGEYFLALAEAAEPKLTGPEQTEWLGRLEGEHDNLRAALNWCTGNEEDVNSRSSSIRLNALHLCGALWRFWWTRGHLAEGKEWCARALATAQGQERTLARAKVLNGVGALAHSQGDNTAARTYYEESLAICREIGDRHGIAFSLNGLGNVAHDQDETAPAIAYYEESLAIRREIGDRSGITWSLSCLGFIAHSQGDNAAALAYYEESLAISRDLGHRSGIAWLLCRLGNVASTQGDDASATAYYEESLAICREIGDRSGIGLSLNCLGSVAKNRGDYAAARANQEESLAIFREVGDRSGIGYALNNLGRVAHYLADYASAWAHFEESRLLFRENGDRSGIAGSLNGLGDVANARGDYSSARTYHTESLIIRREISNRKGITASLEAFAGLDVVTGEAERAAILFGAAEVLREEVGSPLPPNERATYDRDVAKVRDVLGEEAFAIALSHGRAMSWEQAVAFAPGETEIQ
jgi:predicted ATPase/DNA-binding SARP family transcriptional activator